MPPNLTPEASHALALLLCPYCHGIGSLASRVTHTRHTVPISFSTNRPCPTCENTGLNPNFPSQIP